MAVAVQAPTVSLNRGTGCLFVLCQRFWSWYGLLLFLVPQLQLMDCVAPFSCNQDYISVPFRRT